MQFKTTQRYNFSQQIGKGLTAYLIGEVVILLGRIQNSAFL